MNLPGGGEWVIILIIVVLLFGARKLPELSRSVGESIKEFRKASEENDRDPDDVRRDDTTPRDA